MNTDKKLRGTLSWDKYFMKIARAVKMKSKDPNCQVGAVIVNGDKLVISTGFNGFPRRVEDNKATLGDKEAKLEWMVHAEHNAILNAARNGVGTLGCTLYVTKFPCFTCLQAIVQAGIRRIYTEDGEYWKHDPIDRQHEGKRYVIERANLEVDAPNHPSFRPQSFPQSLKRKAENLSSNIVDSQHDITTAELQTQPRMARRSLRPTARIGPRRTRKARSRVRKPRRPNRTSP